MVEMAGANLQQYRKNVAAAAMREKSVPTSNPVALHVSFTFRRPAAHFKHDVMRSNAPVYPYPAKRGDIDKLCRSVLDALTGVWYEDDSQVVILYSSVNYAEHDSTLFHMTILHDIVNAGGQDEHTILEASHRNAR